MESVTLYFKSIAMKFAKYIKLPLFNVSSLSHGPS